MNIPALARTILSSCSMFLVGLLGSHSQSGATEIRLLSAAAMQSVFKQVASEFERTSGHKLIIDYATMGAIMKELCKERRLT
jgi:ABC-type molybdate transport system substrate-binding protein